MRRYAWSVILIVAALLVAGCGSDDRTSAEAPTLPGTRAATHSTTAEAETSTVKAVTGGDAITQCLESAGVTLASSSRDLRFAKKDKYGSFGSLDVQAWGLSTGDDAYSYVSSRPGRYRIYIVSDPDGDDPSTAEAIDNPALATAVGYLRPDNQSKAAAANACLSDAESFRSYETDEKNRRYCFSLPDAQVQACLDERLDPVQSLNDGDPGADSADQRRLNELKYREECEDEPSELLKQECLDRMP